MQQFKNTKFLAGRLLFGALIACAAFQPKELAAAVPPDAIVQFERLPEPERVRALISLAKQGHPEEAAEFLKRFPLQGDHANNRTIYIEGLILRAEGKLRDAAVKFRKALANDPSLTLVRADLAQTLYDLEENGAAKHHLQLLEAEAPSEEAAAGIRAFIDQIDTRKPYSISTYVSFAPTTNINNGTRNTKVWCEICNGYLDIDNSGREKKALGISLGVSGSFNYEIAEDLRAIVSGNLEGRIYTEKDYHAIASSQAAELRRSYSGGFFSLGVISSQEFGAEALMEDGPIDGLNYVSYGPRIAVSHSLTQKDYLRASGVYEWRNYSGGTDQDAEVLTLQGELTHTFDSTLAVTLSTGFSSVDAKADYFSYDTYSGGVSVYREFGHGITLDLGGEVRYSAFDEINVAALKHREDMKYVGRIALTKRDFSILGVAPSIEYQYIWNDSNIALWDYDVHSVDLKFTKTF
jgi:outer membrane protein